YVVLARSRNRDPPVGVLGIRDPELQTDDLVAFLSEEGSLHQSNDAGGLVDGQLLLSVEPAGVGRGAKGEAGGFAHRDVGATALGVGARQREVHNLTGREALQ